MRIGIDARPLLSVPPSAHAATLAQILLLNGKRPFDHLFVLYTDDERHSLGEFEAHNVVRRVAPRGRRVPDLVWLNTRLARQAAADRLDVYFACMYKIPAFTRIPCVNMLHDTAFFNLPRRYLSGRQRSAAYRALLRALIACHCRRAASTITVSEFSRSCILRTLGLPAESVAVCYNAVLPEFFDAAALGKAIPSLPPEYCLFIGSGIPKKNIPLMLQAYALLPCELRRRFPLLLRTSSSPAYSADCARLGIEASVRFLDGYLSSDELVYLVKRASLLVLLSQEEGFGLPVAEAMAAGVPVLTSSGGSLPEIAGGGIDLTREGPGGVSEGWRELLEQDDLRDRVRERGLRLARRYHPDVAAAQLLRLIVSASRS